MIIKSQKDFWSGLMFLCVGAGFAIGATNYSMGTSARPGAGYFPLGLGILTALIGAVILFESLTIETEGGELIGKIAWRPMIVITLTIIAFGWLLPRLGMILTIPILIVLTSLAGDQFRWRGVIISAVVLTAFSWLIFIAGLKLTIPLWPKFIG